MDRKDLDRALEELISRLKSAGLQFSALLYGSAARADWLPGRSDVNLLLVVGDASPEGLRQLSAPVTAWHIAGFAPPLIIGRDEWARAADVFPIEITDMRAAHQVLAGADPLAGLFVAEDDLRRALETELRGKLMRLRQAYVRFSETPITLGGFAAASISSVVVLLRAIAVLQGKNPGRNAAEVVASLGAALGSSSEVIVTLAQHRRESDWACAPEMFVRYLETVRHAVEIVDIHQHGEI